MPFVLRQVPGLTAAWARADLHRRLVQGRGRRAWTNVRPYRHRQRGLAVDLDQPAWLAVADPRSDQPHIPLLRLRLKSTRYEIRRPVSHRNRQNRSVMQRQLESVPRFGSTSDRQTEDPSLIERGSEPVSNWRPECVIRCRSGVAATSRGCRSGRWPPRTGCTVGRSLRRWSRRSRRRASGRRAGRHRSWASTAS